MPGEAKKTCWLRVTTRRMMLLTLILAVLLGDRVHKARVQRQTLAALAKMNAYVLFDYQINDKGKYDSNLTEPPGPQWLHDLIGPEFFRTVYTARISRNFLGGRDRGLDGPFLEGLSDLRGLHISHNQIADEELSELEAMPRLLRLGLMFSVNVGDETIKRVAGMTELEELYLNNTRVTDAGLGHLRGKKLRVLFLGDLRVSDAGLAHLAEMTTLQRLMLNGTHVTDAGLTHLYGLSNLKDLALEGTKITPEGFAKLQKALPKTKITCSFP